LRVQDAAQGAVQGALANFGKVAGCCRVLSKVSKVLSVILWVLSIWPLFKQQVLPRGLCRWAALPLGNAERCQTRKIIPRKCMERKKVYYHCAYTMF
jgi:hypothetical protein